MTLAAGARLDPYAIVAPIGAGGMGEVYKATDTRLERTVAIKVLPAHVASDPERKSRFEREAKTVSSLNHPHICTLYEFDTQDGTDFLVMEYLEGETLADRLTKGALPLDQALRYAIEIADALDKAHRQGVTHRDLKPGNIMLTKAGAKLLDFGLAKLKPTGPQSDASTRLADSLTEQGTILGTFQYMAPEQLEGREADSRTDIWAFGCVVYEMVTGQKAFEGTSQASLIAAILEREPPAVSSLEPMTPTGLDYVAKTCLGKDPDDRWQTARDLLRELKRVEACGTVPGEPVLTTALQQPAHWQRPVPALLIALLLMAVSGLAVWGLTRPAPAPPAPVMRSTLPIDASEPLVPGHVRRSIDVSPDGRWLVYVAAPPGSASQLYLRRFDQLDGQLIPGTEGVQGPFFSSDSQWIAFVAGGELKKVAVTGGAALPITNVQNFRGGSWGTDDVIVLTPTNSVGLARVSANGGSQEVLTIPNRDDHEKSHRFPDILPGGQAVLFTIGTTDIMSFNDAKIAVLSLESGTWKVILEGGTQARYSPTGHIIYAHAGSLFAVPFDIDQLEVTGTSFPVAEDVWMAPDFGTAAFSFSRDGVLVYRAGGEQGGDIRLVWMDRNGTMAPVEGARAGLFSPRLSPSGRQLVATLAGANDTGWILDLERDTLTRFSFAEGDVHYPIWAPDATRIVYGATLGLFSVPMDTMDQEEMLRETEYNPRPTSWSPDGDVLLFQEIHPDTGWDIWVLSLTGDAEPRSFAGSPFAETFARFSPDGRWVAYTSNESGQKEIYVQPYPDPGRKLQVSVDGGSGPVWSRDGRDLFFLNGNRMLAVSIQNTQMLVSSAPRVLFTDEVLRQVLSFDVTADGQRFVMSYPEPEAPATQIHVVQNWFTELTERVPVP